MDSPEWAWYTAGLHGRDYWKELTFTHLAGRLLHATPGERGNYEIGGRGHGIHWPALDEDISVQNLLEGRKSAESEPSLRRCLKKRESRDDKRPS